MTPRQQVFAIAASIFIVLLVFELVRRKRLREEYTWLWILSAATIFLITVRYDLLVFHHAPDWRCPADNDSFPVRHPVSLPDLPALRREDDNAQRTG
jgi:hypothetical protein